jgi:hypothetical protein
LQDRPKFTQIWIFGLKSNHQATLVPRRQVVTLIPFWHLRIVVKPFLGMIGTIWHSILHHKLYAQTLNRSDLVVFNYLQPHDKFNFIFSSASFQPFSLKEIELNMK